MKGRDTSHSQNPFEHGQPTEQGFRKCATSVCMLTSYSLHDMVQVHWVNMSTEFVRCRIQEPIMKLLNEYHSGDQKHSNKDHLNFTVIIQVPFNGIVLRLHFGCCF